jgi:hypothetical protein
MFYKKIRKIKLFSKQISLPEAKGPGLQPHRQARTQAPQPK